MGYNVVTEFFEAHYGEFIWQVLIPAFIWLALMLSFIIFMFIRFTFGNWSAENPNPYQDETFGMPRGTFRGLLTLSLLYMVVVLELVNVRVVGFETEMHEFMVAFQMMIAFYFGSKVMHHVTSADRTKHTTYAKKSGGDIGDDFGDEGGGVGDEIAMG